MPLKRALDAAPQAAPDEPFALLLEQLASPDVGERRRAARGLGNDPNAAFVLAAQLESEPELSVREALFGSLADIGGAPVAELVAPLLRSADAALRGGAIETLKQLGEAAASTLDDLLGDPDPDVRLLAIEVTRAWPSALATPRLQRIFESDPHVNVCGAAVDVATEVGDSALIAALEGLRARFADEPYLAFAIDIACSRVRDIDEPGE